MNNRIQIKMLDSEDMTEVLQESIESISVSELIERQQERVSVVLEEIHSQRQSVMIQAVKNRQSVSKKVQLDDVLRCFSKITLKKPRRKHTQKLDMQKESELSREIKVLAEVEKIWILNDLDDSGKLDKSEIASYLRQMAYPRLEMSDEVIDQVFGVIDLDGDNSIDKEEMEYFLKVLMMI